MTTKIEEELEKEIKKIGKVPMSWKCIEITNSAFFNNWFNWNVLQARLVQHKQTKEQTLAEVEKMIDEMDKKVCLFLDNTVHVVDDCDCCERNFSNVTQCLKLLEELKSKLQEMKK